MQMKNSYPTVLCILDGFGLNPDSEGNAILQADIKNFSHLWNNYPHTQLVTHGERVGLPAGQMGNSEVGHMNIGAGRVVEQWLIRIARILKEDALPNVKSYQNFINTTTKSKTIHLIGLCSNGGVHSHISHLLQLITRVRKDFNGNIALHLITDGRDTAPKGGVDFINQVQNHISGLKNIAISTIIGRLYAMDRDKRWERTQKTYDLLVHAKGTQSKDSISQSINSQYESGITDEFLEPIVCNIQSISPDDGIIFFNFREDRMREIVSALTQKNFDHFSRPFIMPSEKVLCFTEYDKTFGLPFIFEPQSLNNHLGETISKAGFTQLRVAETEKYPHVTYFLNSGIEVSYPGEDRKMVPSPRDVKTYDLKPEMSAFEVKDIVIDALKSKKYDLIVVNFANCDMVGHSGVIDAAIKAAHTVDTCLGLINSEVKQQKGALVVIADHGNAEQMIHYDSHTPHTAHTTFPVPMIVADYRNNAKKYYPNHLKDGGALCDVAPTVLELLGTSVPTEMTGTSRLC